MDIKNFRYSQKKLIDSLKERDRKKRPSTAQILKDKKVATDMKIEEQAEYENAQPPRDYNSAFDLNQAYLDTYNRKASQSKGRLRNKNLSRSKSQKKGSTEENGKKTRPRSAYPLDQGTFGNQLQVVQRGLVKIGSQKTGVESGQFVLSKKTKANRVQSAGPQRTTSYDSNPYGLKRERPQNRPNRIGKDNNYLLNEIDEFSGSGNDETQILYQRPQTVDNQSKDASQQTRDVVLDPSHSNAALLVSEGGKQTSGRAAEEPVPGPPAVKLPAESKEAPAREPSKLQGEC